MIRERGNNVLRGLDRWLGIPLTIPAAFWRKISGSRANPNPPSKIGIFCPGAVGDLLLLSILTSALRQSFPDCEIEILASHANAGALPLNPHINKYSAWELTRPDKILNYIRAQKYCVFIDSSQWARLGNLLANLSGAKLTAGFATCGQFRSAGYDRISHHRNDCHETENFLNLGRAIWPELEGQLSLKLPSKLSRPGRPTIYCHLWPSAGPGRKFKQWPETSWRDLIAALLKRNYTIRLTGSEHDAENSKSFIKRFFPENTQVISIAGQTTWPQLATLLATGSATISVNTGVMHLAAITGCPTIGLHGATNPIRWGPLGPHVISLLPEHGQSAYLNLGFEYPANCTPAMQHIRVETVLSSLSLLGLKP